MQLFKCNRSSVAFGKLIRSFLTLLENNVNIVINRKGIPGSVIFIAQRQKKQSKIIKYFLCANISD